MILAETCWLDSRKMFSNKCSVKCSVQLMDTSLHSTVSILYKILLVYVYWFMCTSLNRSIRLRIGPLPLGLAHQGQSKSIGCWYPLCSLLKLIFFRRVGPKWIYWLSIKLAVADGRNVIAFHPSSLTLFNSSYVCFFTLLLCWRWFRCNFNQKWWNTAFSNLIVL